MEKTPSLTFEKAYAYATNRCAIKEYCSFEMQLKLKQKGGSEAIVNKVLQTLIQENFINDLRFACAFTSDKYRFNHWGKHKIKTALLQKQLSNSIIDQALQNIDKEEYLQNLQRILINKLKTLNKENPYQKRTKLLRFAISKGYNYDEVQQILTILHLDEETF